MLQYDDIADYVLGGSGATESDVEDLQNDRVVQVQVEVRGILVSFTFLLTHAGSSTGSNAHRQEETWDCTGTEFCAITGRTLDYVLSSLPITITVRRSLGRE